MGRNGPSEARRLVAVRVAADAARRAQDEADELAIVAWNARMAEGGPAQPSPTLRVALERGYRYLQVRARRPTGRSTFGGKWGGGIRHQVHSGPQATTGDVSAAP